MEHQNAEYCGVILGRTDYLNMACIQLIYLLPCPIHLPHDCSILLLLFQNFLSLFQL